MFAGSKDGTSLGSSIRWTIIGDEVMYARSDTVPAGDGSRIRCRIDLSEDGASDKTLLPCSIRIRSCLVHLYRKAIKTPIVSVAHHSPSQSLR